MWIETIVFSVLLLFILSDGVLEYIFDSEVSVQCLREVKSKQEQVWFALLVLNLLDSRVSIHSRHTKPHLEYQGS